MDNCPPAMRPPSDEHGERGGGFHRAGNTSHKRNGNGAISAAIRSTSSLNSNEFHRKFAFRADKTAEVNKKQNGKIGRRKTPKLSTYFACEKRGQQLSENIV